MPGYLVRHSWHTGADAKPNTKALTTRAFDRTCFSLVADAFLSSPFLLLLGAAMLANCRRSSGTHSSNRLLTTCPAREIRQFVWWRDYQEAPVVPPDEDEK